MENKEVLYIRRKKIVKVITPFLIMLLIAGTWFLKNSREPFVPENSDFALHVTGELDLEKLKSYGLPIIIDFGSTSCLPCIEMAPVLEKMNKELQNKAIIKFVDVDKYPSLMNAFKVIRVIPTQFFYDKEGKPYVLSEVKIKLLMYSTKETFEHLYSVHEGKLNEDILLEALYEMGMKND